MPTGLLLRLSILSAPSYYTNSNGSPEVILRTCIIMKVMGCGGESSWILKKERMMFILSGAAAGVTPSTA